VTIQKKGTRQIPGQLKMFMTPAEIHAEYQPLDADRHEQGHETYIPRGSDRSTFQGGSGYRRTTQGGYAGYTEGGGKYKDVETPESNDELWSRKLDEAQGYGEEDGFEPKMVGASSRWSGATWHSSRVTTGGGHESSWEGSERYHPSEKMSLHESIGETGVQSPIHLGQTIGSEGKPEVVGGHHRLASATEHASYGNWSHQFLPVLHHASIFAARSNPSQQTYKYT